MGGIDWAGLPIVAELLGVTDPEALLLRLEVIRANPKTEAAAARAALTDDNE